MLIFLGVMVPGIAGGGLMAGIESFPHGMRRDDPLLLGTAGGVFLVVLVVCCLFAAHLMASTVPQEKRPEEQTQAMIFMFCSQLVVAPIFGMFSMFLFASMF